MEDLKYLTPDGNDIVGKRILCERYDTYFKKYYPESYKVMESDKTGTRINVRPDSGALYMNWRDVEDMNIIEVLEANNEVERTLSEFREIERNKPKSFFGI